MPQMKRILNLIGTAGCMTSLVGCAGNRHFVDHHTSIDTAKLAASQVTTQDSLPEYSLLEDSASASSSILATEPSALTESSLHRVAYEEAVIESPYQEIEVEELDVQAIPSSIETIADNSGFESFDSSIPVDSIELNLPSALAMIGGQHPAVGFAQWRVREAYAQLASAEALWLPSIQAGLSFHRHDGNYQASDGNIVDVNRNSFQYGFGTGATGAGTTPRPGLVAQFHLADAIFLPKIAEKAAWARGHAATAVINQQMLGAATAYNDLLAAHQDARILKESQDRIEDLSKITNDFSEAGEGLQADTDRMMTELSLTQSRQVGAEEMIAVSSARLTQVLSLDGGSQITPMDVVAVPIELVQNESNAASLIGIGLAMRPELKESQALVAAACEAHQRERYAPFVPSVLLGLSTGGFGGGRGNNLNSVDSRYDVDALMSWQVRNLGFGDKAARQETSARIQQAKFEKLRVLDQVALEITEAHSQVQFRRQQIAITQRAITSAQDSYRRNLERIRDGQGLPLEVLQSLQALETAQRAYLRAVIDHNQSQFRLQWALGWPN